MKQGLSIRVLILFFTGMIAFGPGSAFGFSDCDGVVGSLVGAIIRNKQAPFSRRNGSAIYQVIKKLSAERGISAQTVYLAVAEPTSGTVRGATIPARKLSLTDYLNWMNQGVDNEYRVVADQISFVSGINNVSFYRVTGVPSVLIQLLENFRLIKWAGLKNPEKLGASETILLDRLPDGSPILEIKELSHLPDLLSRQNSDRLNQVKSTLEELGGQQTEIFLVLSGRMSQTKSKITGADGLFSSFERAARQSRLIFKVSDAVKFQNIGGAIYRVSGQAGEIAQLLSNSSITWASLTDLPSFEP